MRATTALLQAFDHAWDHAYESVAYALDDVSEAEASWQAPCYAGEPGEPDWPAPGTIGWHVAHLAHCKRSYAAILEVWADPEPPPAVAREPRSSLALEREALVAAHTRQRTAVAEIPDDAWEKPACGQMPLAAFLSMTTRHDAWHAAQIVLVRRMYRTRRA